MSDEKSKLPFLTGWTGSNVDKAVKLCNSRERIPVHDHSHTDVIKFLNNGYCDVDKPIGNLRFLGEFVALRA